MPITDLFVDETFTHYFQPIYHLSHWEPIGYEALFRSNITETPPEAFQLAKTHSRLHELDLMSIGKAIRTFFHNRSTMFRSKQLFVNIFPSTVLHSDFLPFMRSQTHDLSYLVLEINESEKVESLSKWSSTVEELKEMGVKIALDDVGKGFSGIESIIQLKPHYIKIDRHLTQNAHRNREKQAFIELALQFCRKFDIKMILEGIEHDDELQLAKSLRVPFAQGYAIGYPEPLLSHAR
ncbi:EAL domain-containing protein [Halobacillus salinus]|uniref:EAL domain-containing protein n=1 Tax=Halobacillus salinus TaxID=192814 RepID=UPI001305197D|nr:EAL domain-containing protein [Halobacillus salinus]